MMLPIFYEYFVERVFLDELFNTPMLQLKVKLLIFILVVENWFQLAIVSKVIKEVWESFTISVNENFIFNDFSFELFF